MNMNIFNLVLALNENSAVRNIHTVSTWMQILDTVTAFTSWSPALKDLHRCISICVAGFKK